MSGSGNNKAWAHTEELCEKICNGFSDVHIITVGDYKCKIIEPNIEGRVTNLSGEIPMRTSMALTGLVDLVIAPDTGIIHASGCYRTPKICILGHNTIECITKHFENDYSVEADQKLAPCAPCLYLIYDMKLQCPVDDSPRENSTGATWCMAKGVTIDMVYNKFLEVYAESQERS
jgi:ADP-heptose:LPS heptosyltransferase